jgi:glycosyltransferase involved in cell wall biosynthesis
MAPPPPLSATVLICTFNRATLLGETLASLRRIRSSRPWEIVVVDNNSTDRTAAVVEQCSALMPVPIRRLFEPRQGKSHALNTGMAMSRGDIIVFTDDDVRVGPGWLDAACAPLDSDPSIDYTGGPVRPLWGGAPPSWIDHTKTDLWGTLAILDYGAEPFVFESRLRVPLGVNMAVRRTLVERIGGFHPDFGRRGRSLLGQEQAEFFSRGRFAGARGLYVPSMELHHHVPRARLTKHYFRKWWFWKGVARAKVDRLHQRTELGLDLTQVPYLAGVPRFIWGLAPRAVARWARAKRAGDARTAARYEMECAYVLGYVRACWSRTSRRGVNPRGTTQTASIYR